MKSFQTKGLVIHKFLIGEGDNFVTFYTQHHGKLKVKVRGAKKVTGRFMGHLEYLNLCNLEIYRGPKNLVLTSCTAIESFPEIKKDFDRLNQSFDIIKLLNKATYEDEHIDEVFALTIHSLELLNKEANSSLASNTFKLKLLNLLGLLPDFRQCTFCETPTTQDTANYLTIKGSLSCENCKEKIPTTSEIDFKFLKLCHFLNRTHISSITQLQTTEKERHNFQSLIDNFLAIHFS